MIDPSADSTPPRDAAAPVSAPQPDLDAQDRRASDAASQSGTGFRQLAVEEVLPIAVALEHRRRQQQRGIQLILRPLPPCPECGARPIEQIVDELYGSWLMWRIAFLPCGHQFDVPVAVSDEAARRAQSIVDEEENRAVGELPAPMSRPAAITAAGPTLADQVGRPLYDRINSELAKGQRAEQLLRLVLRHLDVTHDALGGHDSLGEDLGCAGCGLAQQIRDHLEPQ